MRRDDLDVLDLALTIRAVVFNAHVGKMDVTIDDRKVAPCGPFRNISSCRICVALGTSAIAIQVAEKSLIVALELVVEGDAPYSTALAAEAFLRTSVCPIDLGVVGQLARLPEAGVESLARLVRPLVARDRAIAAARSGC